MVTWNLSRRRPTARYGHSRVGPARGVVLAKPGYVLVSGGAGRPADHEGRPGCADRIALGGGSGVETGLRQMLALAGVDPVVAQIEIGLPPRGIPAGQSFGVAAAEALTRGEVDGFWANGMAAEVAISSGLAKCVVDVRRGDGPPAAFHFTQPALMTTDEFIAEQPHIAAAAIRAIVRTHNALKADVTLANKVADALFPEREAQLIQALITRDLQYYDASVPEKLVEGMNTFARGAGLLDGPPVLSRTSLQSSFPHCWESDGEAERQA